MAAVKRAVCEDCRKLVPAEHVAREGRVYIVKHCPDCGATEAMVSSDAATWQSKRELWRYDPAKARECRMNCRTCAQEHGSRMVFLNVTNRCNMNCPICIANIPGMGFEFHPPVEYFERVLDGLSKMDPKPTVQLFGGEPTVREDLFDIIRMARERELRVRIVTNGLRLADDEFCRRLCEAQVPVLVAFDGRDPEIYARMRKNRPAYAKKVAALQNLRKYSTRKHTIMCCVARGINDKHMRDLVEFCHESRDFIGHLHLIPLTENWEEGTFETGVMTTIEDVEHIMAEAFSGEPVEFLPAGLGHHLRRAGSFFGNLRLTFGGVHPNCESATLFVSDGARFRPVGCYLKRPLRDVADEVMERAIRMEPRLARLDPAKFVQRWRGRLIVARALAPVVLRSLDTRKLVKGNRFLAALKVLGGLLAGRRLKDAVRRQLTVSDTLGMVVLPFEEYHSIDSERLQNCKAGFAFEDPDSGRVTIVPVCSYSLFRDDVERRIMAKYAPVAASPATARK